MGAGDRGLGIILFGGRWSVVRIILFEDRWRNYFIREPVGRGLFYSGAGARGPETGRGGLFYSGVGGRDLGVGCRVPGAGRGGLF